MTVRCQVPPVSELYNSLSGISGSSTQNAQRSRAGTHSPHEQHRKEGVNGASSSSGGGSNQASPALNGAFTRSPPQMNARHPQAPPMGLLAITFVRPDGISYASTRGIALDRSTGLGGGDQSDPSGLSSWSGGNTYVPKVV